MATARFNPKKPLIILPAVARGANGRKLRLRLALDTGSTFVILPKNYCRRLGCLTGRKLPNVTIGTTRRGITARQVKIRRLTVAGATQTNVNAVLVDLPKNPLADGLLGLSFLKHCRTTIDFRKKTVSLAPVRNGRRKKK